MADGDGKVKVRIWDAPVRLFHWGIVLAFLVSWQSARAGRMDIHLLSGYVMLALVLFRIVWGVIGSDTARFARFVRGPAAMIAYARVLLTPRPSHWPGHNPLGAISVMGLLLVLLAQVVLGMFSIDTDAIESGPLAHLVSFDTGREAARFHGLIFDLLKIIAVIHIVVVLYYLTVKRENLIGAMITGSKRLPAGAAGALRFVSPWLALVVAAAVAGLVWLLVTHPPR
ncbi:MAG: cytochrome b/b6 domain-containing protein [Alphaproteobacteria bacterium]